MRVHRVMDRSIPPCYFGFGFDSIRDPSPRFSHARHRADSDSLDWTTLKRQGYARGLFVRVEKFRFVYIHVCVCVCVRVCVCVEEDLMGIRPADDFDETFDSKLAGWILLTCLISCFKREFLYK